MTFMKPRDVEIVETPAKNVLPYLVSAHAFEQRDPAGLDPLGDKDVAVLVEAGIVRMDEVT